MNSGASGGPAGAREGGRTGARAGGRMRHHVALTLAGLTALAVIGLGCVYGVTEYFIERTALRAEMTNDLAELMAASSRGETTSALRATVRYFPPGGIPSSFAAFPAGTFRRVTFEGRPVQLLIAADAGGRLHALAHDLTLSGRREQSLLISLGAGVAIAALGAWIASGRLARRILGPLLALVENIRRVNPLAPSLQPVDRTGDAELDAIPDAVNALVEELHHVLRRERAFADAASHELRTPLAVVRGAIDVLRERGDAPAALVDRMDRAVRRAEEDLVALLALSPTREPAPPRRVDLRGLLPESAEPYLREGNAATTVAWEWGAVTECSVEPATVAIIFSNLLRNALRAAPGGAVRIHADRDGVSVQDDGEGLPDGWTSGREPRGRGLGLAIAGALAERQGWHLVVEPARPRGTVARLDFRAGPQPFRSQSV